MLEVIAALALEPCGEIDGNEEVDALKDRLILLR